MDKLAKLTRELRAQLDRLEHLAETRKGVSGKKSRARLGKARQHAVSATQRKRKAKK